MADPISDSVIGIGAKLIDTIAGFIPNPEEKQRAILAAQAQLQQEVIQANLSQLQINQAEAASGSIFLGGWRSAVGWVCAFSFAWCFVLQPMLTWAVIAYNAQTKNNYTLPPFPVLDTNTMLGVLGALLGLGGLHLGDLHSQRITDNNINPSTK
jgi:hypothetical protein